MKLKFLFVCIIPLVIEETLSMISLGRIRDKEKEFNVCRKIAYYSSGATNPNECWYNPDVDSYAHDIIKRYGYSFESYKVTSNDGYITTLYRIPKGKAGDSSNSTTSRQPVLLLHGLATSSHIMVDIGKQCLAFTLADAGYDVWLGNLRGSSYSLGHTHTTYKNREYWQFSFHEMGKYDLPATLELIFKQTNGKKIIYIGHSLAASVFHVFEAYHRELSKNYLEVAVLVAPIVYLSDIQPPQKELEHFGNPLMILAALMGIRSNSTDVQQTLNYKRCLCQDLPAIFQACSNGFYLAFGLKSPNLAPHYIPLFLAHNPSGFSTGTLNHLLQISRNDGNFQEYDYGVGKNQEIYDDVFPREYDVQGCETPVIIFYGAEDWISTESDVDRLVTTIPKDKVKGKHKIKANVWKHLDYFYGKHLKINFYTPLLESLKSFKGGIVSETESIEKPEAKLTDNTTAASSKPLSSTNKPEENHSESSTTTKPSADSIVTTIISKTTSIPTKVASIDNLPTFGIPPTLFPNSYEFQLRQGSMSDKN